MKIGNLVFIFLFNIAVFKCGINANDVEIPRDIVVQVQNILEIFQNWICDKFQLPDNFQIYLNNFGKRITRLLNTTSYHNIWWLWQLSILTNSVDEFFKINEASQNILIKLYHLSDAIILINNKIKLHLNKLGKEKKNTKKNYFYPNFYFKNKSIDKKQPIEPIAPIKLIPLKLKDLDDIIQEKLRNENNNDSIYTPENLFLFKIILNIESRKKLFTECSYLNWMEYKNDLQQKYQKAIEDWVDIDESYLALIIYRKSLTEAVKISFYAHVALHSALLMGYKSGGDYKNIEILVPVWNSMTTLIQNFIQFFHLNHDFDLNNLYNLLNQEKKLEVIIENDISDIADLAESQFLQESNLYEYNRYTKQKYITMVSYNDLDTIKLVELVEENVRKLDGYLKGVYDLFENVDFEIYKVFWNLVPKKNQFLIEPYF